MYKAVAEEEGRGGRSRLTSSYLRGTRVCGGVCRVAYAEVCKVAYAERCRVAHAERCAGLHAEV